MGVYDYMVNAAQSGQLSEHERRIKKFEKDLDLARQWVEYLKKRIDELEKQNGISNN